MSASILLIATKSSAEAQRNAFEPHVKGMPRFLVSYENSVRWRVTVATNQNMIAIDDRN
jgi:hypothetical protein